MTKTNDAKWMDAPEFADPFKNTYKADDVFYMETQQQIVARLVQEVSNANLDCMAAEAKVGALVAALRGMLAIEDSVTQMQEQELRAVWIPRTRALLDGRAGPDTGGQAQQPVSPSGKDPLIAALRSYCDACTVPADASAETLRMVMMQQYDKARAALAAVEGKS